MGKRHRAHGPTERLLDRVEDRLADTPEGLHWFGPPGDAAAAEALGVPAEHAAFWGRWDGVEIASGDGRIYPVAQIEAHTAAAREEGRIGAGDLAVGEHGRDLLVLPDDPWAEGADVLRVEDTGERWPEATGVARMVLAMMGEASVLYGPDGEFRDDLFDDDGTLRPAVARKLARRQLDLDPDAPAPRFRLGRSLREAGELRAARVELRRVLEMAPEFGWAWVELGRTLLELEQPASAGEAFERGASTFADPDLRAHATAFAALAAARAGDDAARDARARATLELAPSFADNLRAGARDLIEREHHEAAATLIDLGLAVRPGDVQLLALRARLGGAAPRG